MAQDYSEYLAIQVLNEQQLVSYRTLSRALKVHSNLAKQMLYDFHTKQNARRPGSVHATYLLTGTRLPLTFSQANKTQSQKDEDTVMQSSPPLPGSSAPKVEEEEEQEQIAVRSVLLVKEEQLDKAKATFEHISGIHVYSLQAHSLSDVQTLSECNRKIAVTYASEDPLEAWKQYGTIQNPNVKRRTRRSVPPPPPPVSAEPIAKKAEAKTKAAAPSKEPAVKTQSASKPDSRPASASSTHAPDKKIPIKPSNKRQNSDIFKSFAKGNLKAKTKEAESQSSVGTNPPEDESMIGFSDDDSDVIDGGTQDADLELPAGEGKSKKEREADLQAMMDVEDEPMDDAPDETMAEEEDNNAIDVKADSPAEEPKENVTVENGRRRGRRRVMKRKTVKDEDGYLVTKEEAAWESFSEDEPAPKKAKTAPVAGSKPAAAKSGGKPGQGNIMSFFAKR